MMMMVVVVVIVAVVVDVLTVSISPLRNDPDDSHTRSHAYSTPLRRYLDKEKGLPAEAGEWHRLVYLWNDAKESVSARQQLERQLADAEARLDSFLSCSAQSALSYPHVLPRS